MLSSHHRVSGAIQGPNKQPDVLNSRNAVACRLDVIEQREVYGLDMKAAVYTESVRSDRTYMRAGNVDEGSVGFGIPALTLFTYVVLTCLLCALATAPVKWGH